MGWGTEGWRRSTQMDQEYFDFRASDCTQIALYAVFGLTTAGAIALVSTLPGHAVAIWPAMLFLSLAFIFAGLIYVAVRLAATSEESYYDDDAPVSKVLSICFICILGTVGALSASYALTKNVALAALGSVHCSYYGTCAPGANPHRLSAVQNQARSGHQSALPITAEGVRQLEKKVASTSGRQQRVVQLRTNHEDKRSTSPQRNGTIEPAKVRETVAHVALLAAPFNELRTLRTGNAVFKRNPINIVLASRMIANTTASRKTNSVTVAYRSPEKHRRYRVTEAHLASNSILRAASTKPGAGNQQQARSTPQAAQDRQLPLKSETPEKLDANVESVHQTASVPAQTHKTAAGQAVLKNANETLEQTNALLRETGSLLSDIDVVYDDPLLGDISLNTPETGKNPAKKADALRGIPLNPSTSGPNQIRTTAAPPPKAKASSSGVRRGRSKTKTAKTKQRRATSTQRVASRDTANPTRRAKAERRVLPAALRIAASWPTIGGPLKITPSSLIVASAAQNGVPAAEQIIPSSAGFSSGANGFSSVCGSGSVGQSFGRCT